MSRPWGMEWDSGGLNCFFSASGDAPQRAVQLEGEQAYVMRQTTEGQFERTPVTIGQSLGGNVEIVDGLAEGDIIGVVTQVTTAATTPEASDGFRIQGLGGLLGGGGRP